MSLPGSGLVRSGTVGTTDGIRTVVFEDARCSGCDGRCAVRMGAAALPLDALPDAAHGASLTDGDRLRVAVAPAALAWRALGVFGVPILVAAAAAVLALNGVWNAIAVPAALVAAMLAGLLAGRIGRGKPAVGAWRMLR